MDQVVEPHLVDHFDPQSDHLVVELQRFVELGPVDVRPGEMSLRDVEGSKREQRSDNCY